MRGENGRERGEALYVSGPQDDEHELARRVGYALRALLTAELDRSAAVGILLGEK